MHEVAVRHLCANIIGLVGCTIRLVVAKAETFPEGSRDRRDWASLFVHLAVLLS
jgi:hypothetical protein